MNAGIPDAELPSEVFWTTAEKNWLRCTMSFADARRDKPFTTVRVSDAAVNEAFDQIVALLDPARDHSDAMMPGGNT